MARRSGTLLFIILCNYCLQGVSSIEFDYDYGHEDPKDAKITSYFDSLEMKNTPLYFCPQGQVGTRWIMPEPVPCENLDINEEKVIVNISLWYPDATLRQISAFHCWGIKMVILKYWFFFGSYYETIKEEKINLSPEQCKLMTEGKVSPNGDPLLMISDGIYGTKHSPDSYWAWASVNSAETINFFYSKEKLIVNELDLTVQAMIPMATLCKLREGNCKTSKGIIIWQNLKAKRCGLRKAESLACIKIKNKIMCPSEGYLLTIGNKMEICNVILSKSAQGLVFSPEKPELIDDSLSSTSKVEEMVRVERSRHKREGDENWKKVIPEVGQLNSGLQLVYDLLAANTSWGFHLAYRFCCDNQLNFLHSRIADAAEGGGSKTPRIFLRDPKYRAKLAGDIFVVYSCIELYSYKFEPRQECIEEYPISFLYEKKIHKAYVKGISHEVVFEPTETSCPPPEFGFQTVDGKIYQLSNKSELTDLLIFPLLSLNALKNYQYPSLTFSASGRYSLEDFQNTDLIFESFRHNNKLMELNKILSSFKSGRFEPQQRLNFIKILEQLSADPMMAFYYWVIGILSIVVVAILGILLGKYCCRSLTQMAIDSITEIFRRLCAPVAGMCSRCCRRRVRETSNYLPLKFMRRKRTSKNEGTHNNKNTDIKEDEKLSAISEGEASTPSAPYMYPTQLLHEYAHEQELMAELKDRVENEIKYNDTISSEINREKKRKIKAPKIPLATGTLILCLMVVSNANGLELNPFYQLSTGAELRQIRGIPLYEFSDCITLTVPLMEQTRLKYNSNWNCHVNEYIDTNLATARTPAANLATARNPADYVLGGYEMQLKFEQDWRTNFSLIEDYMGKWKRELLVESKEKFSECLVAEPLEFSRWLKIDKDLSAKERVNAMLMHESIKKNVSLNKPTELSGICRAYALRDLTIKLYIWEKYKEMESDCQKGMLSKELIGSSELAKQLERLSRIALQKMRKLIIDPIAIAEYYTLKDIVKCKIVHDTLLIQIIVPTIKMDDEWRLQAVWPIDFINDRKEICSIYNQPILVATTKTRIAIIGPFTNKIDTNDDRLIRVKGSIDPFQKCLQILLLGNTTIKELKRSCPLTCNPGKIPKSIMISENRLILYQTQGNTKIECRFGKIYYFFPSKNDTISMYLPCDCIIVDDPFFQGELCQGRGDIKIRYLYPAQWSNLTDLEINPRDPLTFPTYEAIDSIGKLWQKEEVVQNTTGVWITIQRYSKDNDMYLAVTAIFFAITLSIFAIALCKHRLCLRNPSGNPSVTNAINTAAEVVTETA